MNNQTIINELSRSIILTKLGSFLNSYSHWPLAVAAVAVDEHLEQGDVIRTLGVHPGEQIMCMWPSADPMQPDHFYVAIQFEQSVITVFNAATGAANRNIFRKGNPDALATDTFVELLATEQSA